MTGRYTHGYRDPRHVFPVASAPKPVSRAPWYWLLGRDVWFMFGCLIGALVAATVLP